jgi:hypothetical protein
MTHSKVAQPLCFRPPHSKKKSSSFSHFSIWNFPHPFSNIFLVPSSLLHQQLRQWESNVLTNRFSSFTPLHVTFNPKSHLDAVNQSHTIYFTIPLPIPPAPAKPFCCHPYPSLPPLTQIHSALKKSWNITRAYSHSHNVILPTESQEQVASLPKEQIHFNQNCQINKCECLYLLWPYQGGWAVQGK